MSYNRELTTLLTNRSRFLYLIIEPKQFLSSVPLGLEVRLSPLRPKVRFESRLDFFFIMYAIEMRFFSR